MPEDIDSLVDLCGEHALFERAPFDANGKAARMMDALFGKSSKLTAWVGTVDGNIVGYASATEEFSTWSAASYLYMDCLFVRALYRNGGPGGALLSPWFSTRTEGQILSANRNSVACQGFIWSLSVLETATSASE